jgi:hypothetical protein
VGDPKAGFARNPNPKSESRNPKEARRGNKQVRILPARSPSPFPVVFGLSVFIRISFGFRDSDFEIEDARICVACPDETI